MLGVNRGGVGRAEGGWMDGWQPMRRLLLTTCRGDHLVQEFGAGAFPDLFDDRSKLLVGLVNVALCLDLERGSNQGKERGIEHDCAIAVQRHVHAHQALEHAYQGMVSTE